VVAMDTDSLVLRNLEPQAFPREFDVGVTWKQPTVMKSHPAWLPIKSCLMLFHKERLQGGAVFLKHTAELFAARYADDYWKGDERVLRDVMMGARALLPASDVAAWTSDFQGSQVVFWPAAVFSQERTPLPLNASRVLTMHFRGHVDTMKAYWELLRQDAPLPERVLHHSARHTTAAYARNHGIQLPDATPAAQRR
jgi:hypothetical protein